MSSSSFSFIIEKIFYRNGSLTRLKGELSVYYWPRVAGMELAKKVAAIRFQAGYLYLQTESPALAHQILMMNPDIVKKYQYLLGNGIIRGVKIKVGMVKVKTTTPEVPIQQILLSNDEEIKINYCKKEINDPQLAEGFSKFMTHTLLRYQQKKLAGGQECLSCGITIEPGFNYCPCCEHKVNEEISAYLNYHKKTKQTIKNPDELSGLDHLKIN